MTVERSLGWSQGATSLAGPLRLGCGDALGSDIARNSFVVVMGCMKSRLYRGDQRGL